MRQATEDRFELLATNALPTTRRLRADGYGSELGRLLTPRHYSSALDTVAEGISLAADNDCFQGLDEPAFLAMLEALRPVRDHVRFVSAPDVVADDEATLERFAEWGPRIRSLGFRVALVLQDGMTVDALPWDGLDALFVGGSTEYKLGAEVREIVAEARRRGVWAHMGRVNSYKRARYAYEIGCSSIDGSGWARFKTAMGPRWARLMADVAAGEVRRIVDEAGDEEEQMDESTVYSVTITDGTLVERHAAVDYIARNRLVDFADRHGLRYTVVEADPRPERRSYR